MERAWNYSKNYILNLNYQTNLLFLYYLEVKINFHALFSIWKQNAYIHVVEAAS